MNWRTIEDGVDASIVAAGKDADFTETAIGADTAVVTDAPLLPDSPLVPDDKVRAPRPIAPASTGIVTSQRPDMRWELAPETNGASVEMCRDRAMTTQCQIFQALGSRTTVPNALSRGVWFWRVRDRTGGRVGTQTGPSGNSR